jgi:hypothetical protein
MARLASQTETKTKIENGEFFDKLFIYSHIYLLILISTFSQRTFLTSESRLWSARCIRFSVDDGSDENDADVEEGDLVAIKASRKGPALKHAAPKLSVAGSKSTAKKRMPFYNYRMNESFVLSVVSVATIN